MEKQAEYKTGNSKGYQIEDREIPQDYYTRIPNLIDDYPLSIYAKVLYWHIKKRAGEKGVCYETVRHIADACSISISSVVRARRELESKKLIECELGSDKKNWGKKLIHIKIIDVWLLNHQHYKDPENCQCYLHHPENYEEKQCSTTETLPQCSTTETSMFHHRNINVSPVESINIKDKDLNIYEDSQNKPTKQERQQKTLQSYANGLQGNNRCNLSLIRDSLEKNFHLHIEPTHKGWQNCLKFIHNSSGENQNIAVNNVDIFSEWWWHKDWRGKDGQPPNASLIMELWPQAFCNQKPIDPNVPPEALQEQYYRAPNGDRYWNGEFIGKKTVSAESNP